MSPLPVFVVAVASILVTPGPTNALLTTSAALVGMRRSLPLIFAELAGYLIAIAVLLGASGAATAAFPHFGLILRAGLVVYLLWLAWRFWWAGDAASGTAVRVVTFAKVFVTTLLNPKAPIFAFAIFPSLDGLAETALYFGIFAATTMTVATAWLAFGASLQRFADRGGHFRLPRVTAVVLVLFAGIVTAASIAGRI